MAKIDLVSNEWADLVFEGRNKSYGAYVLRKGTSKRNVISVIIMLAAAALIYVGISLKNFIEASTQKVAVTQVQELSALEKPKEKAEVKQKKVEIQQPEKVVERVKSSVKFSAPAVTWQLPDRIMSSSKTSCRCVSTTPRRRMVQRRGLPSSKLMMV